jgi:hypothetical protein
VQAGDLGDGGQSDVTRSAAFGGELARGREEIVGAFAFVLGRSGAAMNRHSDNASELREMYNARTLRYHTYPRSRSSG